MPDIILPTETDILKFGTDLESRWKNYGLLTAKIYYGFPDYPLVVQTFVDQFYDIAPEMPVLHEFIGFWEKDIEGPLYGVEYVHRSLIRAGEYTHVSKGELRIQ